jgi:glutaredoxin
MLTIYSKPNCPNCAKAKHLLNQRGVPYDELIIGKDITVEDLLTKYPFAKTAPLIFEGDTYKGGFNELTVLYNSAHDLLLES